MTKTRSKSLSLIPALALTFFLAACSGAGGAKNLEVSAKGGAPKKLEVKSGFIYSTPIGLSKNNEVKYASSYSFHIADYEQDGSRGMISLGETPKTDGTQVVFQIVGKEGGDAKTPIEPGDYPVAKPDGGPFQYKGSNPPKVPKISQEILRLKSTQGRFPGHRHTKTSPLKFQLAFEVTSLDRQVIRNCLVERSFRLNGRVAENSICAGRFLLKSERDS